MKPIPLMWQRVTDTWQAVIHLLSRLCLNRHNPWVRARDTAYLKSYATDVLITLCLSPCFVEGCQQGKNSVAINVDINFGYEYFCFVIYFSEIFPKLSKLFFKIFQNFFLKFFFSKFFLQIYFHMFSKFFLRALLSMPPRLQRQNGLYVSVL